MQTITKSLLASLLVLGASIVTASAQTFVGSDNFNDNTLTFQSFPNNTPGPQLPGQWRGVNNNNPSVGGTGGAWTETNQRMEYTNSNSTGFNRGQLIWISPSSSITTAGGAGLSSGDPFNSSWTAQVTATNNFGTLTTPGSFANAGFEIYTLSPGNVSNTFFGLGAYNDAALGKGILVESGVYSTSLNDYVYTRNFIANSDITDVILRMNYNGSSKVLNFDFSNNGATFTQAATFDLDGANMGNSLPFNNGIGLEFYAAVRDVGSALTSGQLTFDNLSVSAIPEPSTYAAMAGAAALGLAIWRRRQNKAA